MKLRDLFLARSRLKSRSRTKTAKAARAEVPVKWRLQLARILAFVAVWGVATFTLFLKPARVLTPYVEGQVADRFVYSEQPFEYENAVETRRRRDDIARQVPPVFIIDRTIANAALAGLVALRFELTPREAETVTRVRAETSLATGAGVAAAGAPLAAILARLSADERAALESLAANGGKWSRLERLLSARLWRGIGSEEDLEGRFGGLATDYRAVYVLDEYSRKMLVPLNELRTPQRTADEILEEYLRYYPDPGGQETGALKQLLPVLVTPNLLYDAPLTQRGRRQAAGEAPVARQLVAAGVALVKRGEAISADDLARLREYQRQAAGRLPESVGNDILLSVLFLVVLLCAAYFLHAIHPEVVESESSILALALVIVGQILLTRTVGEFYYLHFGASSLLLPLLLPMSFGPMLLSQLIGLRAAAWGGALAALVAALEFEDPFPILIVGVLAAFTAAALMRRARRRLHAFRTGFGVGLIVAFATGVFLVRARVPAELLWNSLPMALLNALACAILASFITPLFEVVFGMTTDLTLLELSDLNHPLLKRLQMEAPGTYHHSLMVAALAEEAAAAIGANPLLARVCAYFHDIGKLSNPDYFTENSMGADPHRDLEPRLSSIVILNHVKSGLELAASYKLQPTIREAIAQHHGTNLVYYFYRRAMARQKRKDRQPGLVGESDYRYPGPLPARREIVIISLVDACEAATRSLEKPTPHKIRILVDEIVLQRIQDGQFAEADLTFREFSVVKDCIIKSLATSLHGRIRYPKEKEAHADSDIQSDNVDAGDPEPEPVATAPSPASAPEPSRDNA